MLKFHFGLVRSAIGMVDLNITVWLPYQNTVFFSMYIAFNDTSSMIFKDHSNIKYGPQVYEIDEFFVCFVNNLVLLTNAEAH